MSLVSAVWKIVPYHYMFQNCPLRLCSNILQNFHSMGSFFLLYWSLFIVARQAAALMRVQCRTIYRRFYFVECWILELQMWSSANLTRGQWGLVFLAGLSWPQRCVSSWRLSLCQGCTTVFPHLYFASCVQMLKHASVMFQSRGCLLSIVDPDCD